MGLQGGREWQAGGGKGEGGGGREGGWSELGGSRRTRDITDRTPEISSLPPAATSPLGRPSRGATIRGRKGAREAAKGSDRYNRNAHTFKKQNSGWNFERAE